MNTSRFFDGYQLAALAGLACLGLGRGLALYARGVRVLVIDWQRTPAQMLEHSLDVVCLLLWWYELVAYALPLRFHLVPLPLGIVLVSLVGVKVMGAVAMASGLVLYGLALRAFGDSWRMGLDRQSPGALVTQGPFAWTRNPIYVSLELLAVGTFLVQGRLIFLVLALALVGLIHHLIRQEEDFLAQTYGDAYRDYCARVGRYVTGRQLSRSFSRPRETDATHTLDTALLGFPAGGTVEDQDDDRMDRLPPWRRLLKKFHPEGIPGLGAWFYRAISGTRIFQRHYELIAQDILGYCAAGHLLDVGTGPGRLLLQLHQIAPGLRLTGVDVSPAMVAQARKILVDAGLDEVIEVREGQATQIPFAEGSFDVVISTGSLHHWKDPLASLNEAYRVLKPGGYALMYDLVSDPPPSVWKDTLREFGRWRAFLLWIHAFEEPFYRCQDLAALAGPTPFRSEPLRFVDVMGCLVLKKGDEAP